MINDRNKSAINKIIEQEVQEKEAKERERLANNIEAMVIITCPDSNPQDNATQYAETAILLQNANQGTQESPAFTLSGITRAELQEEAMLIRKMMNADLDSVGKIGDKKKGAEEVEINDNGSVASSITMGSDKTQSTGVNSIKDNFSLQSGITNQSIKSKLTVNGKTFTLESIGVTKNMTDAEVKQRLEVHIEFQRNKENLAKEKLYDEYINSRKQENESTHQKQTNHKPTESTAEKNEKKSKSDHQNPPTYTDDTNPDTDQPASSDNTGEQK